MSGRGRSFVIVRHDNLGDVALALPMAGLLKQSEPDCRVVFAVRSYAREVALASRHVDDVLVVDAPDAFEASLRRLRPDAVIFAFPSRRLAAAARRAGVPLRVGTSRRWFHWLYCNLRPAVRRRGSDRHEAQLNLELLAPFVASTDVPLDRLWVLAGLAADGADAAVGAAADGAIDAAAGPSTGAATGRSADAAQMPPWPLKPGVRNVLLQIRSNGNGKEWPVARYEELVAALPPERFNFVVNGTPREGEWLRRHAPGLMARPNVTDATQGFPLDALMRTLPRFDGVVSNSTGPMHLAALSATPTLGLFVPRPGMDTRRWGPLGPRAQALTAPSEACVECPRGADRCPCMEAIPAARVAAVVQQWAAS